MATTWTDITEPTTTWKGQESETTDATYSSSELTYSSTNYSYDGELRNEWVPVGYCLALVNEQNVFITNEEDKLLIVSNL